MLLFGIETPVGFATSLVFLYFDQFEGFGYILWHPQFRRYAKCHDLFDLIRREATPLFSTIQILGLGSIWPVKHVRSGQHQTDWPRGKEGWFMLIHVNSWLGARTCEALAKPFTTQGSITCAPEGWSQTMRGIPEAPNNVATLEEEIYGDLFGKPSLQTTNLLKWISVHVKSGWYATKSHHSWERPSESSLLLHASQGPQPLATPPGHWISPVPRKIPQSSWSSYLVY